MALGSFSTPAANYLIRRYNMKPNAATDVTNVFSGTSSFSPVVGAFVADAFWGRFRTLMFGIVVSFAAMVVVILSALIPQLKPPACSDVARQADACAGPSGLHRAVLYIGMALVVVAMGGSSPTQIPFGVDQFDVSSAPQQKDNPGLKRYYNWYYVVSMTATFLVLTVIAHIQEKVSWGLGFGIPTALMAATFVAFLAGMPRYVYVPPEGSIFTSVARVAVASCRKWRLQLPRPGNARQQEALLYNPPLVAGGSSRVFKLPLTLQLSFLNKAAIVTDADEIRPDGSPVRPWSLCSVQQVEEVKCLVKVVPVWISGVMVFLVITELTNYTLIQALTMDFHMGKSFTIPQRVTKREGGITVLQRQAAGMPISALALVVAAVVERKRRASALDHGGTSPMSVFLLAPQLAVLGVSAAFTMVGQMEFYNTQFPDQMLTLANSAFYCAQGASSYLATLVVNIVNARTRRRGSDGELHGWVSGDINAGKLDYFYYAMAVFAAVNCLYFLVCSYFYRYKGDGDQGDSPPDTPDAALLKL
ncbi:hypothetical protein ABZP36_003990 [Zizania latifolia]